MAAGVIAAAAGLPLYIIDTASLVSKWVGETEKNLGEVFRAAEAGHAMLLFDEADAIFGKRTDVQNSTDRYANMQTNFLLTQIEMFNGVSILTTNRESVMDQAFQRRLTFRVHFPMPDEDEREQAVAQACSQGHAAARPTRSPSPSWRERLQMSGGYIRNAVMRAGYLAAAQGKPIDDGAAQARGRAGAARRRQGHLTKSAKSATPQAAAPLAGTMPQPQPLPFIGVPPPPSTSSRGSMSSAAAVAVGAEVAAAGHDAGRLVEAGAGAGADGAGVEHLRVAVDAEAGISTRSSRCPAPSRRRSRWRRWWSTRAALRRASR